MDSFLLPQNPRNLFDLSVYGYDLPEDLIAQHPLKQRDEAKLMIIDRKDGSIRHDIFFNIGQYLPPRSLLVLNNSKVIPARLLGRKSITGGEVEVFLLKDLGDGYSFEALLRPLKKIHEGEIMEFGQGITATLINKTERIVRFKIDKGSKVLMEYLKDIGHIPLPPYIKRADVSADHEDYQTIYAKHFGSVASPTAGLHFTEQLISSLVTKGHTFNELTLHINYGTFKPVDAMDIRQHPMHAEAYHMPVDVDVSVRSAKQEQRSIVAVGTTSCRVLEAVAQSNQLDAETKIFIYPGQSFKCADILITNFHLPYSTLLMLVCAFGGYDLMMRAYHEAIKNNYRFYSYGDAMLIL